MGKRSEFPRRDMDKYYTPKEAVAPLLEHLAPAAPVRFAEPFAGDGRLIKHLENAGHVCKFRSDLEPSVPEIPRIDALNVTEDMMDQRGVDVVISNPPWDRPLLHAFIRHFMAMRPTWFLFDADWAFTEQKRMAKKHNVPCVSELMAHCSHIVAVGRVSWMENGKKGKENCAWYLFEPEPAQAKFIPKGGF